MAAAVDKEKDLEGMMKGELSDDSESSHPLPLVPQPRACRGNALAVQSPVSARTGSPAGTKYA